MYEKLYHHLFNAITDVLRLLEKGNVWEAKKLLTDAQCQAEEIYISAEDTAETGKIVEIFGENRERQ